MGLALRAMGFVVFIAAVAGATYGAYELFPPDATFTGVEISGPSDGPVDVLSGTESPVQITARNVGDQPVEITLSSPSEGIGLRTAQGTVQLDANQTRSVRAFVTVPEDATGEVKVRVEAHEAGTDRRLGAGTLDLAVTQASLPTIQVTPALPAVVPGGTVDVRTAVTNPASATQPFNITVEGAQGTAQPASVNVGPNRTQRSVVTVQVPDDAAGTFTATIKVANTGGRGVTSDISLPVVAEGEIFANAIFDRYEVAPGDTYTLPVVVVSNLATAQNLTLAGDAVKETLSEVQPGEAIAGFVTLEAPGDLTGETTVDVTIQAGSAQTTVTVDLLAPTGDTRATDSHQVVVDYIGRVSDGRIFDTSVAEVAASPFPKFGTFQPRANPQPLTINLDPQRATVISGFRDALVGLEAGQTSTAVLPPSQGYGAARMHENLSATTELNREDEVPRFLEDFPRQQLPEAFGIDDAEEGDLINFTTTSGGVELTFKFRLVKKGEQAVTLERMERIGDTTTFYPPWPNATVVSQVTEESIVFRTTPPEDAGNFTWDVQQGSHQAAWENATTVQMVNDTTIVLRHQPEENITYQATSNPRAGPSTYTVHSVSEDTIHVSRENPNPLGGRQLTFDVIVRDVKQAPQGQQGGAIGGGR